MLSLCVRRMGVEASCRYSSRPNSAECAQAVEDSRIVSLNLPAFLPSLARCSRTQVIGCLDCREDTHDEAAVAIAAGLFGVVSAPAVAQNSESAPAVAAPMKSKTPGAAQSR